MTRTIETEFPRTLLLENVAEARVSALDPIEVGRAATLLSRFIRDHGGLPVGPLVQRVESGTDANGSRPGATTLMRQSSRRLVPPPVPATDITVTGRLEVPGCVLVRFRGDASDIDIVYGKLSVFAFENEVVLDGTVYLVFANESGMTVAVDVFAGVLASGRHAHR